MKWILSIVILVLMVSCNMNLGSKSQEEINKENVKEKTFLNLFETEVKDYIKNSVHGKKLDYKDDFYTVCFYNKNREMHFTIMSYSQIPQPFQDSLRFTYIQYDVLGRNVLIIYHRRNNYVKNIFNSPKYSLDMSKDSTNKHVGSYYPKTYRFDRKDTLLERIDTLFLDIFGKDFIEYEKNQKAKTVK